jgi:hypothetical protein
MYSYKIHNKTSGQVLGIYQGNTEDEAIQAMMDDARCTDPPSDDLIAIQQ